MMPFSNRTRLERVGIAGPEPELSLCWSTGSKLWTPLQKQEKRGSTGASPVTAPMPKLVPPCLREKINCLEGECSAYFSPMGWPGIYSICFFQLDGGTDSFPLDVVFSIFIAIGLIRDNEEAIIKNYPTSLIGEIQFDS